MKTGSTHCRQVVRRLAILPLAASLSINGIAQAQGALAPVCAKPVFLTFDTGSQSQAELIRDILRKHHARATFFLANERAVDGGTSLDDASAPYWRSLVADGHAFGSHTLDHAYWVGDGPNGTVKIRPQFGVHANHVLTMTADQYCDELKGSDARFFALTGRHLDPLFRAPGGHVSERLIAMGKRCGYVHVGWSKAGFIGDELSSDRYPNAVLLQRAKAELKAGDVVLMHLGIWSRKDPLAPVLDPLLTDLESRGFCFPTLKEHGSWPLP